MAVSPLFGLLGGAMTGYLADQDKSDELKGNIIDAVSQKVFGVELPEARKQLKASKDLKLGYTNEYGTKFADAFDNLGYFQTGDRGVAEKLIDQYIGKLKVNRDGFSKKIEKMADTDFKKVFGNQSVTKIKEQEINDRYSKVSSIFNDRPNLDKLLVSSTAPQGGIRGALFGKRVTPADTLEVRGKLEKATEVTTPEMDRVERKSIFDVKMADQDFTKGYMFSPAAVDIGSANQVAEAAKSFRGFGQSIQRDATGAFIGFNFAGNKQTEYNAFVSVMNDLGSLYQTSTGSVNLTGLAEAANQKLTEQTQDVLASQIFDNYEVLGLQQKAGAQKADIQYSSSGFSKSFSEKYTTDDSKIKAILQYMSTLGTKSEQQYFAQSIPSINGNFDLRNKIINAVK